jgi:ATP-binding cassette subfamily C (CFTR/MRP) protein 1
VFAFAVVNSSSFIHKNLYERLMRAPMSFFDTTPIGRVLNRFSRDMDLLDLFLPDNFRLLVMLVGQILSIFIVVSISTPIFLAALVPMLGVFLFAIYFFLASGRQLRRLESVTRSPVFSFIAAAIQGRSTIRAFTVEDQFMAQSAQRTDNNHLYNFASLAANRILGIIVDFTSNVLVLAAALLVVIDRNSESMTPGVAGLSIAYALSISSFANQMVRILSEVEMNAVSIERCREYTQINSEALWDIDSTRPAPNWPAEGRLYFKDYWTRYREGLDPVLRGVTLDIKPMEKVGICGRTGAGKSSMTLSLFRLIEATKGSIHIDGAGSVQEAASGEPGSIDP